ncbi:hypothetical protein [Streptomyces sp. NPDC054794]
MVYTLARKAERDHALPVKELSEHQRRLTGGLIPAEAHEEYVRVLTAWAS